MSAYIPAICETYVQIRTGFSSCFFNVLLVCSMRVHTTIEMRKPLFISLFMHFQFKKYVLPFSPPLSNHAVSKPKCNYRYCVHTVEHLYSEMDFFDSLSLWRSLRYREGNKICTLTWKMHYIWHNIAQLEESTFVLSIHGTIFSQHKSFSMSTLEHVRIVRSS